MLVDLVWDSVAEIVKKRLVKKAGTKVLVPAVSWLVCRINFGGQPPSRSSDSRGRLSPQL